MNFAKRVLAATSENVAKKVKALLEAEGIMSIMKLSPMLKRSLQNVGYELVTKSSVFDVETALMNLGWTYGRSKRHFVKRGLGKVFLSSRGNVTIILVS